MMTLLSSAHSKRKDLSTVKTNLLLLWLTPCVFWELVSLISLRTEHKNTSPCFNSLLIIFPPFTKCLVHRATMSFPVSD